MKYFFYIPLDMTEGYKVCHHFMPATVFYKARERRALNIGVSPLSDKGALLWTAETEDGINQFSVTEIQHADEISANMLNILEEAKKQEVDILCLPEMLGGRELNDSVKEKLSEFPDEGEAYPAITILPSIWSNHHNVSEMVDSYGDAIAEQEKQHSFPFRDAETEEIYRENIKPERVIHLIHCPGIGRMAVAICKDALIMNYLHFILDILKVTLLFVPSYSTGSYDFKEILQTCRSADCCVTWINTCSAETLPNTKSDNFSEIGFVVKTGKNSDSIKNGTFICNRGMRHCGAKGSLNCRKCLFIHKLQFEWG